jgi:type IV pilus modification protein PilV
MFLIRQTKQLRGARSFASSVGRANGSTLIEVLVAILLLAFTLLGIAGLLGATTRYQLGIEGRSKLTLLYNDLTNRVRSNPTQTTAYLYDSASWATQQAAIPTRAKDCSGMAATASDAAALPACTASERAADDLWVMRAAVRTAIPQGSLLVAGGGANGFTTTFLWFDKDTTKDDGSPLRQSLICEDVVSPTPAQLHTCCPTVAAVSSTPGVRCLNFTFIL